MKTYTEKQIIEAINNNFHHDDEPNGQDSPYHNTVTFKRRIKISFDERCDLCNFLKELGLEEK